MSEAAKHTPGSIAALAEEARMMPWEQSVTDVPFNARYAFQQAITADHYLELLEALQAALPVLSGEHDTDSAKQHAESLVRTALSKAGA